MKFDMFNSQNYGKEFFGKSYPWVERFIVAILCITIIGNLSASIIGLTVNIAVTAKIMFMAIVTPIFLRLLYLGFMKILHFDYKKIADFFKDLLLGLFAISILLFLCYMMFHDCSGHSDIDLDHVHYERFHP